MVFLVDYQVLNKKIVPNKYLILVINEVSDELDEATIFLKLDLHVGHHHIRVRPEGIHKIAIRTHNVHYEFLVIPLGIMNARQCFHS